MKWTRTGTGLILLLIIVLVGIVIASTWSGELIPRISGPMNHDFGSVMLTDEHLLLEHEFTLVNQDMNRISIVDTVASCGCIDVDLSEKNIEAKAAFTVSAKLRVHSTGFRREQISLILEGVEEPVILTIVAQGRRSSQVTALRRQIVYSPGQDYEVVVLFEDWDSDDMPPRPEWSEPQGLRLSFDEWTSIHSRRPDSGHPAKWQGVLKVSALVDEILSMNAPGRNDILIEVGDAPPLRIQTRKQG